MYIAETQEQAERDTQPGINLLGRWAATGLYSRDVGRRMITEEELDS